MGQKCEECFADWGYLDSTLKEYDGQDSRDIY